MILILGFFLFFGMFLYLCIVNKVIFFDFEVLFLNRKRISMCVLLDWMSCSFSRVVMLISFVVVIYRISYIHDDANKSIFIILVMLFVLSILLLIISPNIISILLGWDGLGLISYCLVIYYQNVKSYNAGILTAMTNRIGDVFILICIGWILNFGRWNYVFCLNLNFGIEYLIGLLVVVASITKRAQIPFSSWLPAAMAAPTPVSALVHSSTLVTAGVYLLIRFRELIQGWLCSVLLLLSVLTIFISGLGAVFENDLKKIIALSTLSQLGLIIGTLMLGLRRFAFFHLLTHALFKSLLFICAGYIIHGMLDCQDIRFMGSVIRQSPLLGLYFNVSNLSLCGMPFLAGFYSKDLILETVMMTSVNLVIFILFIISVFFTVVYTFRLVYFRMVDSFKLSGFFHYSDEDFIMLGVIFLIMLMVLFGGSIITWLIFIDSSTVVLPFSMKILVLLVCLIGGIIGFYLGELNSINRGVRGLYVKNILGEIWFLPYLSTYTLNYFVLGLGYSYIKVIENGWGEVLGGQGIKSLFSKIRFNIFKIFSMNYMFLIFMYLMIVVIFYIFCLNSLFRA